MDQVADFDLDQLWANVAPEALQRTASLARRMLDATAATIHDLAADREVMRSASGGEGDVLHSVAIDVPVRLPGGREIGALRVAASGPRVWDDDDREVLADLAAQLGDQVALHAEIARRGERERSAGETRGLLLAVADRIPGLIFERRKLAGGHSTYTFFGSAKTGLPAVRQMMEGGAAGLSFVHREDREAVRAAILASNLEETDLDLTFRIKDFGRDIRWVRSQSIVRREADGTVCWDGLCFDITDLVAAREAEVAIRSSKEASLLRFTGELQDSLRAMITLTQLTVSEDWPDLFAAHARTIQVAAEAMLERLGQVLGQASGAAAAVATLAEPQQAESASADSAPAETGARILLADDLDLNRKLIADMLSFEGHIVDCVADGAEALRAIGRRRYDLVLMDMIMPGMDGVTATKAIRALPRPACNVPIVALTANSGRDQLDGCIEAGMDAALTKPMSMDALMAAVARWTRGRKAA